MMLVAGRQLQGDELLVQLRELLFSPSPTTPPPLESVGAPPCPCDGSRRGSKRSGRDDDEPATARHSCKTRRRTNKQQQQKKSSRCLVTSVPDFDGYQWRKYGQKQIEGALYDRSYYRCVRSAEQGCLAKRTVQRNEDCDGAPAEYKVVYMGDHTCTTKLEAPPVILETTAVPAAADNNASTAKQMTSACCYDDDDDATTTTTSTSSADDESPAISNDDITWSSSSSNVHDSWQDFISGPIRSPVHAADAYWTIDHDFLIHDMIVYS